MNIHCTKNEISEDEGINRLNKRIKELKNKKIVPPVDSSEPTGLLSGGPEYLELDEDETPTEKTDTRNDTK